MKDVKHRKRTIQRRFIRAFMATVAKTRLGFMEQSAKRQVFAQEVTAALESLGPTFIKMGQILSVRPDIVGPELLTELSKLRDDIEPLLFSHIKPVIEDEIGNLRYWFSDFDTTPIASASIAQVYRAKLAKPYRTTHGKILEQGTPLAVKVVRPLARRDIETDLKLVKPLLSRLSRLKKLQGFPLESMLHEIEISLMREFNLRFEGQLAERFKHDFRKDLLVTAPEIVWPASSDSVLTMELIDGWTLDQTEEIAQAGIDSSVLALHGAEVFMRQVLELGYYHADLHPSNLLVTTKGQIAYIDFGIAGSLSVRQQQSVAQVLLATVYADPKRAIKYSRELGIDIPAHKEHHITERVGTLMNKELREEQDISAYVIGFLQILADENISIPQGFGILAKGLITVEGCARLLDPNVDIMNMATPYITKLMAEHLLSPQKIYEKMPLAIEAALRELLS